MALDRAGRRLPPTLFGITLIGGWLLTFLLGILQRIVPFLASMHKPPGKGPPRTPSSLTDDRPLAVHFWCHLAALALLALAHVAVDSSGDRPPCRAGRHGLAPPPIGAFFVIAVAAAAARTRGCRARRGQ